MHSTDLQARQPTAVPGAHLRKKLYLSPNLPPSVSVGTLCLNCQSFDLEVDHRTIQLTPAEFDLLYYFMSHAGQIFSADELLCHVWQYPPGIGKTSLIRAHIKNLRTKIEPDPKKPIRLITVEHLGYTITVDSFASF